MDSFVVVSADLFAVGRRLQRLARDCIVAEGERQILFHGQYDRFAPGGPRALSNSGRRFHRWQLPFGQARRAEEIAPCGDQRRQLIANPAPLIVLNVASASERNLRAPDM
ncbi:MAG: hypothetical protein AB7O43_18050 [Hyphomicrobiaceae bacterium]